ncbi:MATE family efflux transporter [Psychromonas hadalis]|uniref:MATE family efflux transporter n=1 Tax=Psychromonas hadalis TaxID=211669 RepID=UPI0003B46885|nr:MATE family efflux transporter [Psychromonas hadalis]
MQQPARFLQGSIFKHVITMSATNAIGLSAIFMVDLVDIYFISLLQNSAYTAAIGYASAIIFFTTAIGIGLTTANGAIVSKYIGQNKHENARQYVAHISIFALLLTTLIAAIIWVYAPHLLQAMGAKGEELKEAIIYLRIIVPSLPILALSMQMSATLRSLGDAKHAMYATLVAGIVNALLDPIFIFVLGMDLQGAAIASVLARFSALFVGIFYVVFKYKMITLPRFKLFSLDLKIISSIALPAMLTQIATPLGNIYVTYEVAQFGTEYIAGWAIIGRVIPVAFGMMFAVSGAIGPIIGQNHGALNFARVREVLIQSLKFITAYCLVIALLLSLGQEMIIKLFNAKNETAEIIRLFCHQISITFIFTGITFVAMAFLNNLGYAKYATLLNVAKMTLGTIPFVTVGAFYYGAAGILYGQALGSIVFGFVALFLTHKVMNSVENRHREENNDQSSTS